MSSSRISRWIKEEEQSLAAKNGEELHYIILDMGGMFFEIVSSFILTMKTRYLHMGII